MHLVIWSRGFPTLFMPCEAWRSRTVCTWSDRNFALDAYAQARPKSMTRLRTSALHMYAIWSRTSALPAYGCLIMYHNTMWAHGEDTDPTTCMYICKAYSQLHIRKGIHVTFFFFSPRKHISWVLTRSAGYSKICWLHMLIWAVAACISLRPLFVGGFGLLSLPLNMLHNKKNIRTFRLKKVPYQEVCVCSGLHEHSWPAGTWR